MSTTHSTTTPTASAISSSASPKGKAAPATSAASKAPLPTPPAALAPSPVPPAGYTPTPGATRRRYKKLPSGQASAVGPLATEIQGSSTYEQDFGSFAPNQTTLVNLLHAVAMLEAALGPAQLWATYVNDERTVIIDATMTLISQLAIMFKASIAQDSAVAQKYPNLVAFLAARGKPAERATATKKESKKKKAAASAAPAPAAAASVAGH